MSADFQALSLNDDTSKEFTFLLVEHDGWKRLNEALRLIENQKVEGQSSEL
jgi:hypothetical protein